MAASEWVPYVSLGLAAANLAVVPLVLYAFRSRIRDEVVVHDRDPHAHAVLQRDSMKAHQDLMVEDHRLHSEVDALKTSVDAAEKRKR